MALTFKKSFGIFVSHFLFKRTKPNPFCQNENGFENGFFVIFVFLQATKSEILGRAVAQLGDHYTYLSSVT